jgi:CPA1 family monovalent cation:H+ antiporter
VLSILGVVVSAGIVSGGMVWLLAWPLASALTFGVLIAATDPVAVIAMFKDTGIGGRLRLLVESESLFNDGVAAVLFGLVFSWIQARSGGPLDVGWAVVTTSGGGIAIGLIAGAIGIVIMGRTREHIVEAAVTAVVAYGSFLLAEYLHVSGSLGLRGSGKIPGLSTQGRVFVLELWDFAAFLANSLVFLLIGATVARIPFAQLGYAALGIAIALVLVGRALTVYPISLAFRGSRWAMSAAEQHVLWWGGLRGALALALTLSLPSSVPLRDDIVIVTFGVVAFSVLAQGLTMPLLLRRLGLLAR